MFMTEDLTMTTVFTVSILLTLVLTDVLLVLTIAKCREFDRERRTPVISHGMKNAKADGEGEEDVAAEEKRLSEKFKREQDEAFGVLMNYDVSDVYKTKGRGDR